MAVMKYVRVGGVWRYKPVVTDKGKILPDMIRHNGKVEHHPEGKYHLLHERKWIKLETMPLTVREAEEYQQAKDLAIKHGLTPPPVKVVAALSGGIKDAIEPWLAEYKPGHQQKTVEGLRTSLLRFLKLVGDRKISSIGKADVIQFWQMVVDESPTKSWRTAFNETNKIRMFLVSHGVEVIGKGKGKWKIPKYTEELVEVYEEDEIRLLLDACDPRRRAAYTSMHKGLLRERECVFLAWSDVDPVRNTLKVTAKPQYGFKPKKLHEREVTVPRDLINLIMALPKDHPLVFAKPNGEPDKKLLRKLKQIAKQVGIDPTGVWCHKWRASGATRMFRMGVPLPDIMATGGWRDLKSVQRYAGRLAGDRLSVVVEAAWA